MRCSCVPIHFGTQFVGIVKLVAGAGTSARTFSAAVRLLELTVSGVCQDYLVCALSEQVESLRERVAMLGHSPSEPGTPQELLRWNSGDARERAPRPQGLRLVENALAHIDRDYQSSALSLRAVALALHCNPRYLTGRFTAIVGERMHTHVVRLRVGHACRLLMSSDIPVKEVAYASGFRGSTSLARVFRRQIGVSPSEYRRIFAAG